MMKLFSRIKSISTLIIFKLKYPKVRFLNPLKFGSYYSQVGQDVYLSALLFRLFTKADKKIIIDIGCNHPINYSNSYFFEKHFLCEVLAFDPISEYNELWTTYRPSAKFYPYALDEEEGELILNVPTKNNSEIDDMFSSISKNNTHLKNFETDERKIKAVPLKKVLKENGITDILFVSIDVEGFELSVLKGIDFEKVKIACFIIENNTNGLLGSNEIREYLLKKDYIFITRILYFDDVFIHKSLLGYL